jgi:hypothetical protein
VGNDGVDIDEQRDGIIHPVHAERSAQLRWSDRLVQHRDLRQPADGQTSRAGERRHDHRERQLVELADTEELGHVEQRDDFTPQVERTEQHRRCRRQPGHVWFEDDLAHRARGDGVVVPADREDHRVKRHDQFAEPLVTADASRLPASSAKLPAAAAISWAVTDTCRLASVSCSIVSTTWQVAERCCWVVSRT